MIADILLALYWVIVATLSFVSFSAMVAATIGLLRLPSQFLGFFRDREEAKQSVNRMIVRGRDLLVRYPHITFNQACYAITYIDECGNFGKVVSEADAVAFVQQPTLAASLAKRAEPKAY